MNTGQRIALFGRALHEHAIVWCVVCVSGSTYFILRRHGLEALAPWFVPDSAPQLLQPFSIWRLWTPTFVHYTLAHLLANCYVWWLFATRIESESRLELIVVFVITAACANSLQWWVSGPDFGGLSGVAYALLSYLWVFEHYAAKTHYRVDPTLRMLMLALIPLAATGIFGKFANFAHIGGLVSGAALAAAYIALRARSPTAEKPDTGAD